MIEKIVNVEKKYLSAAELADGATMERYAYLVRIARKVDVNKNPYLTFYLRTIDRVTVIGHKFRVAEDDSTGLKILSYNRMMVRAKFEVQVYNGTFTLLMKDVSLLPQEDASPFFDTYEKAADDYDYLSHEAALRGLRPLNAAVKSAGLFSVRNGLTGAYLELLSTAEKILRARENEHTENLVTCLLAMVNPYFQYLQLVEKLEFLPKREIMEILQTVTAGGDSTLASIAADALSALMGQGQPEHLYAHLICSAFNAAKRRLALEDLVKACPKNLVIGVDEGRLVYY